MLRVRDLGSLNGTYVGQQRVEEAALPHGELLTIATVNFRAEYEGMDPSSTVTRREDAHDDEEDAHHEVANNDSTHGLDRQTIRQTDERPAVLNEMPQPPVSRLGPAPRWNGTRNGKLAVRRRVPRRPIPATSAHCSTRTIRPRRSATL